MSAALAVDAPALDGPMRTPTSWLAWLEDAFAATPARFRHVLTVWRTAVAVRQLELAWLEPAMADRLELAALLHDVGRALDPCDTEPHGFVGARFLDQLQLHDVAPLVAHHSGARHEAAARGMADHDLWSVGEPNLLAVLTLIDRTTSPTGDRVTISERRADLVHRYGHHSWQVQNFDAVLPEVHTALVLLGPPAASLISSGA